ncbi:hypothetical protein FB45DRAFT_907978 [Roridomyces roridus]|uniref:Uncharacterized protein n=1 Tax=Roridomyces roridus TaxID=1738132 RepID=A0AAD7C298_9AGAR|nr:hypothetical protein FB45DRAFT_907978 [Roridomyces roridus]
MTTESLNLNSLASSLPSNSLNPTSEKELLDNFKAAALSITTLYRSSRHASKRAYNAGYAAACRDLMEMLQQGVSDSHTLSTDRNQEEAGMSIGRIMDWVEARLDAVRSREEEEDEEDERERGGPSSAPHAGGTDRPSAPVRKPSPSPPPSRVTTGTSSPPRSSIPLKPTRAPPNMNLKPITSSATSLIAPMPPADLHVPISFPFLENVPPPVTGSKRRHAVMMMPPPTSSAQSTPSSSSSSVPTQRRRTRSSRGLFPHNHSQVMDSMMDIEEEGGRERKRVARR